MVPGAQTSDLQTCEMHSLVLNQCEYCVVHYFRNCHSAFRHLAKTDEGEYAQTVVISQQHYRMLYYFYYYCYCYDSSSLFEVV